MLSIFLIFFLKSCYELSLLLTLTLRFLNITIWWSESLIFLFRNLIQTSVTWWWFRIWWGWGCGKLRSGWMWFKRSQSELDCHAMGIRLVLVLNTIMVDIQRYPWVNQFHLNPTTSEPDDVLVWTNLWPTSSTTSSSEDVFIFVHYFSSTAAPLPPFISLDPSVIESIFSS